MYKLGLDIGGTKCAIALGDVIDSNVKMVEKSFFPTVKDNTYKTTLFKIEDEISRLLKNINLKINDVSSIGISCGGPLDSNGGIIMSPPNLPGWDNVHIVKYI